MCLGRLGSVFSRLKGKPEMLKEYNSIFMEQLDKGIIERVPEQELSNEDSHFISHHLRYS